MTRFVVIDGGLIEDRYQAKEGRGIYCCGATMCRDRLARNRKLLNTGVKGQGLAMARGEGSV